ncbi:peptidylprolyl isomerase [bacterium]|nr:peptidylprolyl isomerase [bacterium]
MRLMELIRRKGRTLMLFFLGGFLISVFAGLTVGGFDMVGGAGSTPGDFSDPGGQIGPGLTAEDDWDGVALRVNGRAIDSRAFYQRFNLVYNLYGQGGDNPGSRLELYGITAGNLIEEEILISLGEEVNVEVTKEDIQQEKINAISRELQEDSGSSGNIFSDAVQKLGSGRKERVAFGKFLDSQSLSEEQWTANTRQGLFMQKTKQRLQELADEQKEQKVERMKGEIDARLAEGESFADLAREYSEDANAEGGGDLGTWLARGLLFQQSVEDALFDTPKGEITDWFDIPAGWQRFEVYDKKEAEGKDFEAKRDEIVEQLYNEHEGEDDYEPTEEEIARAYVQVMARQIMLNTRVPQAAQTRLEEETAAADVEINVPYVLAHQALHDAVLQPPHEVSMDQLVEIAKSAVVGEGYDFGLIQAKRDAGQPAGSNDEAGEDAGDNAGEDGDAESPDDADPPEDADQLADPVDDGEAVPIYALAIGLFTIGLQGESAQAGYFPYYIVAKTYLDWLDDDEQIRAQPLERDAARERIEENLARSLKSNDYSAITHAYRGLNLAWLDDRQEEAYESLDAAQKYAPRQNSEVWDIIRQAYTIYDDQEKLDLLDERLAEFRREQLRKVLEEAQQGDGTIASSALEELYSEDGAATGESDANGNGEDETPDSSDQ